MTFDDLQTGDDVFLDANTMIYNHPLNWWGEAAYLSSRIRNRVPRFAVERAVRMTFRR